MFRSRLIRAALILLLMGVVLRLAAPTVIKTVVNHELGSLNGYVGSVIDVDVELLQGGYRLQDMVVVKQNADIPYPLVKIPDVIVRVDRDSLGQGRFFAALTLSHPEIHTVHDPVTGNHQIGLQVDWPGLIKKLMPIPFDTIRVEEATTHFHNLRAEPPVELTLNKLQGQVDNIFQARDPKSTALAGYQLQAKAMNHAAFSMQGKLALRSMPPDATLMLKMSKLDLSTTRNLLAAYTPLDIESGEMDLEVTAEIMDSELSGKVEPTFSQLNFLSWGDLTGDDTNLLSIFSDALVGAGATLLTTPASGKLALSIPVSGDYRNPQVDFMAATASLFAHALWGHASSKENGEADTTNNPTSGGPRQKGRP